MMGSVSICDRHVSESVPRRDEPLNLDRHNACVIDEVDLDITFKVHHGKRHSFWNGVTVPPGITGSASPSIGGIHDSPAIEDSAVVDPEVWRRLLEQIHPIRHRLKMHKLCLVCAEATNRKFDGIMDDGPGD